MFNEFAKKVAQFNTTLPTLSNGDESALQLDSSGRLAVVTRGAPLSIDDNGGSITVDGTVDITDGGGSITVDGTVTVDSITNDVSIDDGGNSITVDNAGTFAVQEDGPALTALQLIDNLVLLEDAAAAGGEAGVQMLAVRQDTLASSTSADGDFASLKVNANGELYVTGSFDASVDDIFESGTEADAASDNAGDGIVAISGASMTALATIAVGAGVTLYITGLDYSADDQSRFELIVDDNGTPSEWIRVGALDGLGNINKTFPRAIEISGAADRSVILRAQKLSAGSANAAGAINAYSR